MGQDGVEEAERGDWAIAWETDREAEESESVNQ